MMSGGELSAERGETQCWELYYAKNMELFDVERERERLYANLSWLAMWISEFLNYKDIFNTLKLSTLFSCCYRDKHLKMALQKKTPVNLAYTWQWNRRRCMFSKQYTSDCTESVVIDLVMKAYFSMSQSTKWHAWKTALLRHFSQMLRPYRHYIQNAS